MLYNFLKKLFTCTALLISSFTLSLSAANSNHPWVVRVIGDNLPSEESLRSNKILNKGELEALEGFYEFDFSRTGWDSDQINEWLEKQDEIVWFEEQVPHFYAKPDVIPGTPLDDPQISQAWHILNSGQKRGRNGEDLNLLATWNWGLDGSGVLVAVIDEGTQLTHPDLVGNIRHDLALDLIANDGTKHQLDADENHGTAVSGIIAATDNTIGSVGVAYGAHLVPIRYIGGPTSDLRGATAIGYMRDTISIYNNSWGPALSADEDLVAMIGLGNLSTGAIQLGIENGRGGLGSIYVFAGGNGRLNGENANYNGWANLRETIAVGAVGNSGVAADYSEPGAALLVSAPSSGQSLGILTTDVTGALGYEPTDYTSEFGGTSAAAPMVSGVIALMLQANPLLTWRDIQHILVHSAIQINPDDDGWEVNGAALPIHNRYGFGRIDASSAIQTAMNWASVADDVSTSLIRSVNRGIPTSGTPLLSTATINQNIKVEHVTVELFSSHSDWGNLEIKLISPSGTESVLASPHTDEYKTYESWTYMTTRCWDEESAGDWRLEVSDLVSGDTGSLLRWEITVYGTSINSDQNQKPVVQTDSLVTTEFPATIPVIANDSDPDGDPITIISLYQPAQGTLEITDNQEIRFTPGDEFLGIDRFGYTISDGRSGIADTYVDIFDPKPYALPDQAVVATNQTVLIPFIHNDIDHTGDPIELLTFEAPASGINALVEDKFSYTPNIDFVGKDTFEYTITDNNHGNGTGTVDVYVSSDNDFAMRFDGVDDQVVVEASAGLDITTDFTFEASFYLESFGESGSVGFGRILDRDTYNLFVNGSDHQLYPDGSLVVAFELPSGTTVTANSVGGVIEPFRWHQVAATYNGIQVRMWIDGVEQEVQTLFGEIGGPLASRPTATLYLGEAANQARAFEGVIDWIKIWKVIRSDEQIVNSTTFVPDEERSDLVGWWQFNEGTDVYINDSYLNRHPGIAQGAKWVPKDPALFPLALE
ncbi:MAG: S8 family serine peptidase [Opitutales bacterium]|nr:S8 family serine peptidase [Opitutales bacterium]